MSLPRSLTHSSRLVQSRISHERLLTWGSISRPGHLCSLSSHRLIIVETADGSSRPTEVPCWPDRSYTRQTHMSAPYFRRQRLLFGPVHTCAYDSPTCSAGTVSYVTCRCDKVIPPMSYSGSWALQNSYAVVYPDGVYTINPRCTTDGVLLFGGSAPNQQYLLDYVKEDERRRTDDSLTNFGKVTEAVQTLVRDGFGW